MHSAARWRARTSNTSSCSHDGSRTSTAQRIRSGASGRNASSRPVSRRQRGGSCRRFGPRWAPSRSTRSRWFASHVSGSPSFLRWVAYWPTLHAYRKPGGAWSRQCSTFAAVGNR